MTVVDITNYRTVIRDVAGKLEEQQTRESIQAIPEQEGGLAAFPIAVQGGGEKFYSETFIDKLLEQNSDYRRTFEETDAHVAQFIFRMSMVFAAVLVLVVLVMSR